MKRLKLILLCFIVNMGITQIAHAQMRNVRLMVSVYVDNSVPVVSIEDVKNEMAIVNDIYNEHDINFDYCIQLTDKYTTLGTDSRYLMLNVTNGSEQVCAGGTGGYAIIGSIFFGARVIAHELGHCLGLDHTFGALEGQDGILFPDPDDPYHVELMADPDGISDTGIDWSLHPGSNPGNWGARHFIGNCGPNHSGICGDGGGAVFCPFFKLNGTSDNGLTLAEKAFFGPQIAELDYTGFIYTDGNCTTTEDLSGKIALVDEIPSGCSFTTQVQNAQDRGAVAVIVCKNGGGDPFRMGGSTGGIDIPSLMISNTDCETIKMNLTSATGEITLTDCNNPHVLPLDYDLDNCDVDAITFNPDDNLFTFYMEGSNIPLPEYPPTNATVNFMSYLAGSFRNPNICDLEFTPMQGAILQGEADIRIAEQMAAMGSAYNPAPDINSVYLDFTIPSGKSFDFPEDNTYVIEQRLWVSGTAEFKNSDVLFVKGENGFFPSSIVVNEGGNLSFEGCAIQKTDEIGLCHCSEYEGGNFSLYGHPNSTMIFVDSELSEARIESQAGFLIFDGMTVSDVNIIANEVNGYVVNNSSLTNVTQDLDECFGSYLTSTNIQGDSWLDIQGGNMRLAGNFLRSLPIQLANTGMVFNYLGHFGQGSLPNVLFGNTTINSEGGTDLYFWEDQYMYNGPTDAITGQYDKLSMHRSNLIFNDNAWINGTVGELILNKNYIECSTIDGAINVSGCTGEILNNNFAGQGSQSANGMILQADCQDVEISCNRFENLNIGFLAYEPIGDQGNSDNSAGNRFDDNTTDVFIAGNIDYYYHNSDDMPNAASIGLTLLSADAQCSESSIAGSHVCGLAFIVSNASCPGGMPQWFINAMINRYGKNCVIVLHCDPVDPCDDVVWINHQDNQQGDGEGDEDHPCNYKEDWQGLVSEDDDFETREASRIDDQENIGTKAEVKSFKIYPNPTSAEFTLELIGRAKDLSQDEWTIQIYSLQGDLIDTIITDSEQTSISSSKYNSGLYLIQVFKEGILLDSKKLIVTK